MRKEKYHTDSNNPEILDASKVFYVVKSPSIHFPGPHRPSDPQRVNSVNPNIPTTNAQISHYLNCNIVTPKPNNVWHQPINTNQSPMMQYKEPKHPLNNYKLWQHSFISKTHYCLRYLSNHPRNARTNRFWTGGSPGVNSSPDFINELSFINSMGFWWA